MPTPRAGAAVVVLGKQILVVGGVGEDQTPLKVVEMYNTEEGRWRKRSALREALMGVSITMKGMDYYSDFTESLPTTTRIQILINNNINHILLLFTEHYKNVLQYFHPFSNDYS